MPEKPISALTTMLDRIIARSDSLHEEMHEFDDELSHHVSHLLKKIAKLTGYVELESTDKAAPEVSEVLSRNLHQIKEDLTDLHEDAHEDPAILGVVQVMSKLFAFLEIKWATNDEKSRQLASDTEMLLLIFQEFETLLQKLLPIARSDIAVRHAYLALRELAKFWRANDDLLAANLQKEEGHDLDTHDHEHNNEKEGAHGHTHTHSHSHPN